MTSRVVTCLVLAVVGVAVLATQALVISSPGLGLAGVAIGFACLVPAAVLQGSATLLPLGNAAAAALLLLQVVGACASRCGGYDHYAYIMGMPVAVLGVIAHGALGWIGISRAMRKRIGAETYRHLVMAGVGVSAFFAALMLAGGTWCGSCAAAHAMVLWQVLVLARNSRWQQLLPPVATAAILALALNAWYHHGPRPASIDVGAEIQAHLQQLTDSGAPVAAITVRGPGVSRVPAAPAASLQGAGDQRTIAAAVRARPIVPADQAEAAADAETSATLPPLAGAKPGQRLDYWTWGRADAPLRLVCFLSFQCPHCRAEWQRIRKHMTPLAEAGTVRVDLAFIYPLEPREHRSAKAAAYFAYYAGMVSEEALLAAVDTLFSSGGGSLVDELEAQESDRETIVETLSVLLEDLIPPASLPQLAARAREVEQRIRSNYQIMVKRGTLDTPHFAWHRSGVATPYFVSKGFEGGEPPEAPTQTGLSPEE